jgi:hypothetical protein
VDPHLADVLAASGGGASAGDCNLQVGRGYKSVENLVFFKVDPETRPDNAYTAQLPSFVQNGDCVPSTKVISNSKPFPKSHLRVLSSRPDFS